jgi:hypothetical protein
MVAGVLGWRFGAAESKRSRSLAELQWIRCSRRLRIMTLDQDGGVRLRSPTAAILEPVVVLRSVG